jgi:hypothetical protein
VYADGNLEGSNTISAGTAIDIDGFGREREHGSFNGQADEIQIYNTRLSESEIDRFVEQTAYDTGWYESANHSVSDAVNAWTKLSLTNATANVEWQAWNSSSATWQVVNSSQFSSTGNHTLDISGTSYEKWRTNVTFQKDGSNPTAELHNEGILVETSAPTVDDSSLSPNSTSETLDSTTVTLEANVSDADFGRSQGDELTAEWYVDGSLKGTTTVTSNGTASYTIDSPAAGEHDWHVDFSDQYGQTTSSATASFTMPDELRIYKENATDTLVDSVTVELRFHGVEDDTLTVERETTNGKIDMTGLPVDEEFVVVAKADDYYNRRIYIASLVDQQNVYLLPKAKKAVYNVFALSDKSGTYPAGETRLIIQRGLNVSGQFQWTTVSGDFFGATNDHQTYLRYNQRYRLIIENNEGDRRVIGSYMATDEDNPKVITVKSIVVEPPEGQSYYGTAWVTDEDPNTENNVTERTLWFTYSDSQNATDELRVTIHERGNSSNEIANITVSDVGTEYAYTYTLEGEQTETAWVVNWTADRNGDTVGEEFPIGETGGLPLPMDSEWLARFGLVALPVMAALGSERNATYAAMGTTAFAGILMVTGIWDLSVYLWFAALVISVGGHLLTTAQRGGVVG